MEEKDRKYHSNPSQSKSYGQYSPPIPASMLAQMEAMRIQEEKTEEGSSSSHGTQLTQEGGDRSTWHRTNRQYQKTIEHMDIDTTQQAMVKRPRVETEGVGSTTNLMAGPAEQASQPA
jgi:hypothetical protein